MYLLPVEYTCVIPEKLFEPFLLSFPFGKELFLCMHTFYVFISKSMCFQCILFVIKTETLGNPWNVELCKPCKKQVWIVIPDSVTPVSVPHFLDSHTLQCACYCHPQCL